MAKVKGTEPKVAYIYKESSPTPGNGTWHPIAGLASTNVDYTWTGVHNFSTQSASFSQNIKAKGGVNNFQDPTERDDATDGIPTPATGAICLVRQTDSGAVINELQVYNGTRWVSILDIVKIGAQSGTAYTLSFADLGRLVNNTASSSTTITVPTNASVAFPIGSKIDVVQTGTGQVAFAAASGVAINSKNSWLRTNAQYSAASLIKTATDTWLLIGDLKS